MADDPHPDAPRPDDPRPDDPRPDDPRPDDPRPDDPRPDGPRPERRFDRITSWADRVTTRADRLAQPALRHVWRVGGSLAAVGMLGFGTLQSVSQLAHEEETIVTELDGSGLRAVVVDNSAGGVQIVGTDSDTVTVRARVSHGMRSTGHSERIDGERLVLEASCPVLGSNFCEVGYRVEVPEDVALELRAEGRITVSDVTGSVDASTDNGRVEVARVEGDVRLSSDNGRVVGTGLASPAATADSDNGRVELTFVEAPRTVDATSDNGSVEVVVPDTPDDYVLNLSSDNGTATGTNVRTGPDSGRTVTASSDNGDVTVRYP